MHATAWKLPHLAVAALALATPGAFAADDARGRPNIVFVLTDDLSMNLVQFMPQVQQMKKDGMYFPNYFVTDSLCCPSRSSIFTGRFPHNTGVFTNNNPDGGYDTFNRKGNPELVYAKVLQNNGYKTAMMGKYLNGYKPADDPPKYWSDWVVTGNGYPEYNYTLNVNGHRDPHGDKPKDYLTDVLNQRAQDFITRNKDVPFQIEIATFAPHSPYTPAPQDKDKYPNLEAPTGPAFDAKVKNGPKWLDALKPLLPVQKKYITTAFRKRARAVQAVDRMIGDIRQTLKKHGIEDKTYIVFSSDNGYHLGQWRLEYGKQTPYTTDINVPLVVVGPGIKAGSTNEHIVQNTDLCPTFADIGGGSEAKADGVSLLPLLHGATPAKWRDAALVEHHGPNFGKATAEEDPDMDEIDKNDPEVPQDHPDLSEDAQKNKKRRNFADPPTYEALRGKEYLYVEYADGFREHRSLKADPNELVNDYDSLPQDRKKELANQLQALKGCSGGACTPGQ